jgi:hypothetical protein
MGIGKLEQRLAGRGFGEFQVGEMDGGVLDGGMKGVGDGKGMEREVGEEGALGRQYGGDGRGVGLEWGQGEVGDGEGTGDLGWEDDQIGVGGEGGTIVGLGRELEMGWGTGDGRDPG